MFPETPGFICRSQPVSKIHVPIYPCLVREGETKLFDLACDRHSNETGTLRKPVTKYKNIRKWMVEFLRKS